MTFDSQSEVAPIDKTANRAERNFLSATAMLGHLIALYDRGIFEAARLMSNLIYQLAITGRSNSPLLGQVGPIDQFVVVVDSSTLSKNMVLGLPMSPLVTLMMGIRKSEPVAHWIPAVYRPDLPPGFEILTLAEWLKDRIIPSGTSMLSRSEVIKYMRDQDGGSHSDPDSRLPKSQEYLDLVNAFPPSKLSAVVIDGVSTLARDLLPPVTHPIMRQIAHELLSAIHSNLDLSDYITPPPGLVCRFDGVELMGVFVPPNYIRPNKVYGEEPTIVPYPS